MEGFFTKDGLFLANGERIGGAPNVPETGPGAQRHYLLVSGGLNDTPGIINENEGLAIVWEELPLINEQIYRSIHAHVAKHVTADRGGVIISPVSCPVLSPNEVIYVGFVGRCMTCPNPERISIHALKASCLDLNIKLNPDWKDWEV